MLGSVGAMGRRSMAAVAAASCAALTLGGCTDVDEPSTSDELSDFATTSEPTGGMPYDVYLRILRSSGGDALGFADAEARAAALCTVEGSDPAAQDEWSGNDRALVRAYCPELELPG